MHVLILWVILDIYECISPFTDKICRCVDKVSDLLGLALAGAISRGLVEVYCLQNVVFRDGWSRGAPADHQNMV